MRFLPYIAAVCLFAGVTPAIGAAPDLVGRASIATPLPPEQQRVQSLASDISDLMKRIADVPQVAGLAGVVVHEGRVLMAEGAGVTDVASQAAVDADTVFRLASLSKAFAATVAAQLVQEGVLDWDMHVQPWLPGLALANPEDTSRLTLRDVLSHRVGLPFNTLDRRLEANEPYPVLVETLQSIPMTCSVGDCFGYQNVAFSLIGDMVFATTGNFYSFQVEKRIFTPLGMHTATHGREALESSSNWARPHVLRSGRLTLETPKDTYYRVAPAAGINASAKDLGQWLIAQMGGFPDVLPPELLAELHTPQVETPYEIRGTGWRTQRLRSASYGLGWRIMDYAGERMIFHAGAVQGYRGMIGFLPDRRFGVAFVWNSESYVPAGLLPVAMDRYLNLPEVDWIQLDRVLHAQRPATTRRTQRR
ncbi:serine hydrolase domain-containing protein [Pseudofulvimonas gallinarii]|jgi:beta-lactamase class C|uniref:Beta-lactamase class C n=1 Tax=Pseudofulvimonas gallinarii TaxID=634155 RepID=A0A4S3KXF9_9GAMM|nr:serine hydrolase domain-containing protein [Pseudofulvimonas gallinarii]TCS93196.1 beta-lactamase class C [Pseudofulvimonas gallinarii]THD14045.1 hypothetical protein B1808_05070 [Pseudofulvimonas gallinarii]